MAPTETELMRLALLVYEAASEPAMWPRFLELYNEVISSDATLLQLHDLDHDSSHIFASFGLSSPLRQSYNEHYSKLNVWREGGRSRYIPGSVNLDQEQCPRSLLERSEFYNDFLRRLGADHSMGAVIARREKQVFPTLTSLRGRHKGEYGEDERRVARFLLPYLGRAWTIYERLEVLAAGESVLDRLPLGIIFVRDGAITVYSNRSASEILRADDGLTLKNHQLSARSRIADTQLRKSIAHVLRPANPPGSRTVLVPRTSCRRPYQVAVAPIRSSLPLLTGMPAPRAVIFVTDPERSRPANRDLLIQLFGLTRKEAEMSVKLSDAKSVEQAAEEMGITYETARTHLRHIFNKTGTSRQTELLLLIARLPNPEEE